MAEKTQIPVVSAAEEEVEIDLMEVANVLLRKWTILLAGLVAGAGLALGITTFLITPQYTASSMIYIYTKTTSITSLTDLQIGSQLTVDFKTLGTTRLVVERVITDLGLDTTYEELLNTITIENPTNTRILKILVENPDPKLAADISNDMATSLSERIAFVMGTDQPSTVETAVIPDKPSSPSLPRNTAIGGLLGVVLCAAIVLMRYFLDDTVKTEEDVTKYLSINTLAAIPLEHYAEDGKKTHKDTRKKHSTPKRAHSGQSGIFTPKTSRGEERTPAPAQGAARKIKRDGYTGGNEH